MNKIIAGIIFTLLISSQSQAQLFTAYNLFPENLFIYNPALAGSAGQFGAFIDYKHHLTSIPNAPKTAMAGFHSPVFGKMGLGGMLKTGRVGLIETSQARLDYAYRTNITAKQQLALGINGGLFQRNLSSDLAVVLDDSDPTLGLDYAKKNQFYLGGGIDYHAGAFNLSVSLPALYRAGDDLFYNTFVHSSYTIGFGAEKKWGLRPAASVLFSETSLNAYQIHASLTYNQAFFVRATYKSGKSFVGALGMSVGKMGITYAYETNNKSLAYIGGATHEIGLSYGLIKTKQIEPKPLDTLMIAEDEAYIHQLKRMIEDDSYDQYVKAGNFAFYNEIVSLTDSMYRSTPPKVNTPSDTSQVSENTNTVKPDTTAQNTNSTSNPVQNLSEKEKSILEQGVHFKESSAMLDQNSRDYLNEVAELLISNKKISIQIVGHTCDIGSKEANMKFSKERAETVRYYLILQGVPENQITTDARADAEPVVPNTNEENRQQNRRVSFSIIRK